MAERRLRPVEAVGPGLGAHAEAIAGVLHDLRSPLTVIAGACFALRRIAPTAEALRLVERIEGEASRIAERADAAGRIAGIGVGRLPVRTVHDLAAIVDEVVTRFRVAGGRHGVDIDATGSGPLPVRMSPDEVERLVENLMANAVRHAGPGGRVAVDCALWGADAVVRVTDDGAAGRRAGTGWGVGLSEATRIAAAHGGDVAREPSPVGAVFRLRLPIASGGSAPAGGRAA